jgi:cation transport regulator ChaC
MDSESTWIFGYGSLIWRTGFDYQESRPAFIRDWARRFWQGSTDHRGVPGAPGRVVTLVPAPGEACWGRAYLLDPATQDQVLAHLDHREKGGYERLQLPLYFDETCWVEGTTYHATAANPNYLGEAGLAEIVTQVASAFGPSGRNIDYVLQLDLALAEMGASDEHVTRIAAALREMVS